jgi:hypothetical protein
MQHPWFNSDDISNYLANKAKLRSMLDKTSASEHQPLLVFSHVPKAGGTTLEYILAKNFKPAEVLHINAPDLNRCPELIGLKSNQPQFICGHHPMHGLLYSLIPEGPLVHLTMVRDPIDRVLSFYNYIINRPAHPLHQDCRQLSFNEFLSRQLTPELSDGQVRRFSGTLHNQQAIDQQTLNEAIDTLQHCFSMVLITELFDESLLYLQAELGFRDIYYQPHNVSVKTTSRDDLTQEDTALIQAMNPWDSRLYQWARERLIKQINQTGVNQQLSSYRQSNRQWQALLNQGSAS